MSPLLFFVPVWFVVEIAQLVVAERYLGVKQVESNADPRLTSPRTLIAALWSTSILTYWIWLAAMLLQPIGRAQIVAMIGITLIGFSLRRSCGLKWVLVVMTFEGAIRIGMLLSLGALIWRRL